MQLKFSKMHGAGNDFIVIDGIKQTIQLSTEQIKFLADRHFGIGCDQLLLVEAPQNPAAEFRYRIFNADGSEVEQCGNGARCFARFVYEQGLTQNREIRVETQGGLILLMLTDDGRVTVDMGIPRLAPHELPYLGKGELTDILDVGSEQAMISTISMGNPHAVMVVDNVLSAPVNTLGPAIESHPAFPKRVNVGFMQIVDEHNISLRVFERGSGETLSCGTGACAAAVSAIRQGLVSSPVNVTTRGGVLSINWGGDDHSVLMTGPASTVFTGVIEL